MTGVAASPSRWPRELRTRHEPTLNWCRARASSRNYESSPLLYIGHMSIRAAFDSKWQILRIAVVMCFLPHKIDGNQAPKKLT